MTRRLPVVQHALATVPRMTLRLLLRTTALLLAATATSLHADQPLTGTVVDPTGSAVPGLTVTIQTVPPGDAAAMATITDSSGHFRMDHLRPGRYRVRVDVPESFAPLGVEVSVRATS